MWNFRGGQYEAGRRKGFYGNGSDRTDLYDFKKKKLEKEEQDALNEAETAIATLPEEPQRKIRKWLEFSVNQEAEDQRRIYLGGLADGVWLDGKVYLSGLGERSL